MHQVLQQVEITAGATVA